MGFDAMVYIDLAAKTRLRFEMQQKANEEIKKNGYTPKPKVVKPKPGELTKVEAADQLNGQQITVEFGNTGKSAASAATVEPTGKSSRKRKMESSPSADFGSEPNNKNNTSTARLTQKLKDNNELVSIKDITLRAYLYFFN